MTASAAAPWIAPGAVVVGEVTLGDDVGVWYGAVIRADRAPISIGAGTNVQDNAVLHADPDFPLSVGAGVVIGHQATVHGCTVEDDVLVGMGAVLMNGAVIGAGSIIAAGAVISPGTQVPPRSLVAGVPGKVRRDVTEGEVAGTRASAARYVETAAMHRDGRIAGT